MRVIIIEDEPNVVELICSLLNHIDSSIKIVGNANSVETALTLLQEEPCDIAIMDIQLKGGTSMDVLSAMEDINFGILFLTSHKEYALQAFEYEAIDYIMKPVNSNELLRAIEKAKKRLLEKPTTESRILVNTADSLYAIKKEEIIRLKADDCYTEIYTTTHKKIVASKTLKEYEKTLLNESSFIRIHRSHIINVQFFNRIHKDDGGMVELTNGDRIPFSQNKKQELLRLLLS